MKSEAEAFFEARGIFEVKYSAILLLSPHLSVVLLIIRETNALAHRLNQFQFKRLAVILIVDNASHHLCQQIPVNVASGYMIANSLHFLHERFGKIHVAILQKEICSQRDGDALCCNQQNILMWSDYPTF